MEMSIALQVALFMASLSIVVLVACLIPIALQARRQAEQLVRHIEDVKANTQLLAHDCRELVQNLTELTKRANHQLDEVGDVIRTVKHWSLRADRVVDEVGSAIEPPVFALVRQLNVLRTGVGGFLQKFMNHKKPEPTNEES